MTGFPRPVAIGAAWLLTAAAGATAQELRTRPYEFGVSLTLQSPPDVNVPPQCQLFSLPCMSPKPFPDLGVGLVAAVFPRERVGLAAELGGFSNQWRSSSSPDGRESNAVQFAVAGPTIRSAFLRYGKEKPAIMRVFAQVMAGVLSSTVGSTERVWQAGIGADGLVDQALWFRIQFDYRVANSGPRELSSGRALFALLGKP
jgi:hypothetical protein